MEIRISGIPSVEDVYTLIETIEEVFGDFNRMPRPGGIIDFALLPAAYDPDSHDDIILDALEADAALTEPTTKQFADPRAFTLALLALLFPRYSVTRIPEEESCRSVQRN